jgi:type I restriction enzyme S subunit
VKAERRTTNGEWPKVALDEVAELNPRLAETLKAEDNVSFVPMSAVSAETAGITDEVTRTYAEVAKGYTPFVSGDVLVAKITPCFENGKIAQALLTNRAGFGSTEFHVVRPHANKLDARYTLHFLRLGHVRLAGERRMTGSAGQRRVPENFLSKLKIPLPPLAEQRRIAEVLDRAEALRAKRRAALAQLDSLTQSLFLDMFGDPASKRWPMTDIVGVAKTMDGSIRTGPFGSQLLHTEFTDEGIAVLGIDNAVANEFRWGERRFISEAKYRQLKRYTVRPGDVIITIMGTCGRCAVVPDDIPTAINTKHLCCITLDPAKCLPIFLHAYFLQHPIAQKYLHQTAKGAIMSGLNMELIKRMPVPLPPLELQDEFTRRVGAVEKLKTTQRASLAELDALFASLQYRAFRGEL